ncbi:MAG: NifB/NifX family molybdenum-iron cluster-binding protein [Deltaproteobacteria bacterium]|nr:NifB/NifX family molybdenum-iron cluster-binding protein [Deltaproteobacteria bacterium]
MKIAVTSSGKNLESNVDPRFGRAAYFIIVNPETMDYEVVENIQNLSLPQGAGIQAGQTIAGNNVDVLFTGNCGPKAFKVLQSAGIKIITNVKGSVLDAISMYKKGELETTNGPNVEGHWV